ncbi:MAG: ribosome small subunit-dependent GTPase A, partial [Chitinophagaceae bacterium]
MKAIVYKSTGSWYSLKDEAGKFWNGRMKGVMKLDDITSTNPVAVGDWVHAEIENEGDSTATINEILDRNNYINRQS